jgi:hypothetical protein
MAAFIEGVMIIDLHGLSCMEQDLRLHIALAHHPEYFSIVKVSSVKTTDATLMIVPHQRRRRVGGRYRVRIPMPNSANGALGPCASLELFLTAMRFVEDGGPHFSRTDIAAGTLRLVTAKTECNLFVAADPSIIKGTVHMELQQQPMITGMISSAAMEQREQMRSRIVGDYIRRCIGIYSTQAQVGWQGDDEMQSKPLPALNQMVSMTHLPALRTHKGHYPLPFHLWDTGVVKPFSEDFFKALLDRALVMRQLTRDQVIRGAKLAVAGDTSSWESQAACSVLALLYGGYVHMLHYESDFVYLRDGTKKVIDLFSSALIPQGQAGNDCEDEGGGAYQIGTGFEAHTPSLNDEALIALKKLSEEYVMFGNLCDVASASYQDDKDQGHEDITKMSGHMCDLLIPIYMCDRMLQIGGDRNKGIVLNGRARKSSTLKTGSGQGLQPMIIEGTAAVDPMLLPVSNYVRGHSAVAPNRARQQEYAALQTLKNAGTFKSGGVTAEAKNWDETHDRSSGKPVNRYYRWLVEAFTTQPLRRNGNTIHLMYVTKQSDGQLVYGATFDSVLYGDPNVGFLAMPRPEPEVLNAMHETGHHMHPVIPPQVAPANDPIRAIVASAQASVDKFNQSDCVVPAADRETARIQLLMKMSVPNSNEHAVDRFLTSLRNSRIVTSVCLHPTTFRFGVGELLFDIQTIV